MGIPGKSKLKKVSLTASRIVGLLVGIVVTGYYANSIWHVFCVHKLGWGDTHPESYLGIEDIVIFVGSAILWLGGAYWRLRVKNRTRRYSEITRPSTGSPTAFGFRRPSSPAKTLTFILKLSGVILGSALFFPVSCTTALIAGIQINSLLLARDLSHGDKPYIPFHVLTTAPTGNICPIELFEVDTYIEKTPDGSFLLAQSSGDFPGASRDERFSWRVISSKSNEQLVEVCYYDGDTTFINRYRAMQHSISPVSSRMWYHGYMFASFPFAIGFGLLVYWLGRRLRRKYVVRTSERVKKWVKILVIICILGMAAATILSYVLSYVAYRKSFVRQEQVISDFNKALEIDPKDTQAYSKRGIAHVEKGLYEQAISDLTKALEIDPRNGEAYFNRGYAYRKEGKYDQAISDFNKALEIDPRNTSAYNNRGLAYRNKGHYEQAFSDFNKAIEINPRDADAYTNRGLAHDCKGQYERAISDYTKALEINPGDDDTYIRRGQAYAEKGHYEQAISDYTKALEINPRYAKVYVIRAYAYYFQTGYEKSWKDVEKAQYFGFRVDPKFLEDLRQASGRKN